MSRMNVSRGRRSSSFVVFVVGVVVVVSALLCNIVRMNQSPTKRMYGACVQWHFASKCVHSIRVAVIQKARPRTTMDYAPSRNHKPLVIHQKWKMNRNTSQCVDRNMFYLYMMHLLRSYCTNHLSTYASTNNFTGNRLRKRQPMEQSLQIYFQKTKKKKKRCAQVQVLLYLKLR